MFRRLNDAGELVFERHVEGPELDVLIQGLPTTWPRRKAADGEPLIPVMRPVIRTAAVDPSGHLWIAFAGVPYTYVYDARGERIRVVQFRGAGIIATLGIVLRAARPPAGPAPGRHILQL